MVEPWREWEGGTTIALFPTSGGHFKDTNVTTACIPNVKYYPCNKNISLKPMNHCMSWRGGFWGRGGVIQHHGLSLFTQWLLHNDFEKYLSHQQGSKKKGNYHCGCHIHKQQLRHEFSCTFPETGQFPLRTKLNVMGCSNLQSLSELLTEALWEGEIGSSTGRKVM